MNKPYRGHVIIRKKMECDEMVKGQKTLGHFHLVYFLDHPYNQGAGNISASVNETDLGDGRILIETVNSTYHAVTPEHWREILKKNYEERLVASNFDWPNPPVKDDF